MNNIHELIIYRNILNDRIISKFICYIKNKDENHNMLYDIYGNLINKIETSDTFYSSSLFMNHLINLILNDQNVFSLNIEKHGTDISNNLLQTALHDIEILLDFYKTSILMINTEIQTNNLDFLTEYKPTHSTIHKLSFYENITKLIQAFESSDVKNAFDAIINLYNKAGVGAFGQCSAFVYDKDNGVIPIKNPDPITFNDLIGYEYQKNVLIQNTQGFVNGRKANNVLLFGDKGTGKSSCVKALVNKFKDSGLRIIEITKDQIIYYNKILDQIRNRGQKFIIFIDDLSFEEFEVEYKYMKAMIEGRVESKPDNVLIYATSNRRHLIKESFSDSKTDDDEIRPADTVQEKTSLAARFGITITFVSPNQQDYLEIVYGLAKKNNIEMPCDELKSKAIQWELWHNGRSGRTAEQFITNLMNELE